MENKDKDKQKTLQNKEEKSNLFQKGRKKTGGRKKGVKNKVTKNIRKILEEQLLPRLDNIGQMIDDIVEPEKKAAAIASLLPFVVPKFSNTTINADTRRDISTEQYIKEMHGKYAQADISIDISTLNIVNNK